MKKKLLAVAAAGALTAATAVPALALENEFHGLFRAFGFVSNAYRGDGTLNLNAKARTNSYIEQRARLMYIAKANDDLKLVTHFELDSRWGGVSGVAKYPGNDAGQLDADSITLETKNVYLDFKCPLTGSAVKLGIQPWADSYKSVFLLADMTGLTISKKFDPLTVGFGWFRMKDDTPFANPIGSGKLTNDLLIVDGKYAINKDLSVGASYYNVQRDTAGFTAGSTAELIHMVGLNAAAKFGPATVEPFVAYQFGDFVKSTDRDLSAWLAGATAKVKAGPGNVNASVLYLSGEKNIAAGDRNDFQIVSAATSYFNPANMWLLVSNANMINSRTAIGGNDLTKGGRGFLGFFAGYEGAVDKLFYSANVGYAETAIKRAAEGEKSIGTEVNLTVGYKLYDNLSVSATGAYAFLGDLAKKTTALGKAATPTGNADDPYVTALQFNYVF